MEEQVIIKNKKKYFIILSIQQNKNFNKVSFENFIHKNILLKVNKNHNLNTDFKFLINSSKSFVV